MTEGRAGARMSAIDPDALEDPLPEVVLNAPWPLLARLPALLAAQPGSGDAYRQLLLQANDELKARFLAEEPVETLVHARAALVDTVLRQVWREQFAEAGAGWALVAVGGYGRAELHPASDIDILLLVARAPARSERAGARATRSRMSMSDAGCSSARP